MGETVRFDFRFAESREALASTGLYLIPGWAAWVGWLFAIAPLEGQDLVYTFDDEGLRGRMPTWELFQSWAGVDRLIDRDAFFCVVAGNAAYYIPARAFSSPDVRAALVGRALDRLTPAARARSRVRSVARPAA